MQMLFYISIIVECSHTVEVKLLEQLVSLAHAYSLETIRSDSVLVYQQVLHILGTIF